jgi:hypothetical protein
MACRFFVMCTRGLWNWFFEHFWDGSSGIFHRLYVWYSNEAFIISGGKDYHLSLHGVEERSLELLLLVSISLMVCLASKLPLHVTCFTVSPHNSGHRLSTGIGLHQALRDCSSVSCSESCSPGSGGCSGNAGSPGFPLSDAHSGSVLSGSHFTAVLVQSGWRVTSVLLPLFLPITILI